MAVRFTRLRITGFKSFADAAAVEFLPGLTGIVGPNGCGKSNIVDALRWVMGEANPRSLRGGEMEDVIFAGTASRAARNSGEVTISLEDTAGLAPPPFDAAPELEVTRRIERGAGSTYRVNGRETRARDVQTLFADFASGARASAMITQGRVAALVNARPEDRRSILEEAAGVAGLHARRHEAELKLRGAEANLARAEDARGPVVQRLTELRKQARQAKRYRDLSAAIRAAESDHLAIDHAIAATRRGAARLAFAAAEAEAGRGAAELAKAAAEREGLTQALLQLRGIEAEARTRLERARAGAEQASAAEQRLRAARHEADQNVATLKRDHDHAVHAAKDADDAVARLHAERLRLQADQQAAPMLLEQAGREAEAAAAALEQAEAELARAAGTAARIEAETAQARRQHAEAETLAQRRRARHEGVKAEHQRAKAAITAPGAAAEAAAARQAAEAERIAAETALDQANEAVMIADAARREAETQLAVQRSTAMAAETRAKGLCAEAEALASLLAQQFGRDQAPVLDDITVPSGLEAALSAALRDDLAAGTDRHAARHWRHLPPLDAAPLPPLLGTLPSLGTVLAAPPALARALDHVLLLPAGASGDALQNALAPGQSLVSRDGALWRWDGLIVRAGAPSEAAARLAQRNRLKELRAAMAGGAEQSEAACQARAGAEVLAARARAMETEAREARRLAERHAGQSRAESTRRAEILVKLEAEAERAAALAGRLETEHARAAAEAGESETALARAKSRLSALPDASTATQAVDEARARLAEARRHDNVAQNRLMQQRPALDAGARRFESLCHEAREWAARAAAAQSRLLDVAARRDAAQAALGQDGAGADPAAAKRAAFETRDAAEAAYREAADALATASHDHDRAERAMRRCEAGLGAAREALARQEGLIGQADHAWSAAREAMLQRLGAAPPLPDLPDATPEAAEAARLRFDRLSHARDEMGPVNLRAEIELAETEARITAIERDRDDIAAAIAKLRGSIGYLNRQGRERLSAVFAAVDAHFQALFTRMFGGGHARLELSGTDDPLQAGLEIYAQPPGKKLAALSLLSGGEQALTALSLIFAVFRCNPAPISVLDEVDAPLDDANVERFCALLDDLVRETGTRMLVVTHHHLTMARMDRLYGVTMQERGISRLLSVDLGHAARLTEQGPAAHGAGSAIAAE